MKASRDPGRVTRKQVLRHAHDAGRAAYCTALRRGGTRRAACRAYYVARWKVLKKNEEVFASRASGPNVDVRLDFSRGAVSIPDPRPFPRIALSAAADSAPLGGGVYFIWDESGDIQYVGQTGDFRRRFGEHIKNSKRGMVSWIPVEMLLQRLVLETIYLVLLRPVQNRAILLRISKHGLSEIRWRHGA